VTGTPSDGRLVKRARDLVDFGRRLGYGPEELIAVVEARRTSAVELGSFRARRRSTLGRF
jgi:hypothetical protein